MTVWDCISGGLEFGAAGFNALNLRRLVKDKAISGFSPVATAFFTSWGFYNLFFYPHLGQWISFFGGMTITTTNIIYLYLIWKYTNAGYRKEV